MRTLKLTLKLEAFEVMVTGEKNEEFRLPSRWIKSRLFNSDGSKREYDRIEYVNGYGAKRPRFETDFLGFELFETGVSRAYSNGLTVDVSGPIYVIKHSRVLKASNIVGELM